MPAHYPDNILTAAAFALCAQLAVTPCAEYPLLDAWLKDGGMCGNQSCNSGMSCPNDRPCADDMQRRHCIHIYDYPTIGDLKDFERDGTLNGAGGKSYLCKPETPTS